VYAANHDFYCLTVWSTQSDRLPFPWGRQVWVRHGTGQCRKDVGCADIPPVVSPLQRHNVNNTCTATTVDKTACKNRKTERFAGDIGLAYMYYRYSANGRNYGLLVCTFPTVRNGSGVPRIARQIPRGSKYCMDYNHVQSLTKFVFAYRKSWPTQTINHSMVNVWQRHARMVPPNHVPGDE